MISKEPLINKRPYLKPEVIKVTLDTSIVVMQVSNPNHHHGHTVGDGNKGTNSPFESPFGDKPFN